MASKKGKLILIAGPSGVGKKTLIGELIKDSSLNLMFSISCTTRKKRTEEQDGIDYFFISKEEFQRKIDNGQMLEYAHFFDNYYGTPKEWVEEKLSQGINILLEIETEGFNQIVEKYPDVVSIFILPTSLSELERRLRNRGTEDDHDISMRLKKAEKEIIEASNFKYQVVNDDIQKAVNELKKIITSEL
ncbi:guanylate kinase [Candidatus Mycoplasma haematohominis]|uniref:Guanylate kinase n=1 Tax=Candidatus Mycoplasma haematohominis TaxID=1494318 RepID=A0A478FQW7_9MOLU|nr:guanylate kinase [Candidatus Mycoplasma haemohominis]GCE63354.1 guanylate kinase [Candidatus Mycoplasma haemohominis]